MTNVHLKARSLFDHDRSIQAEHIQITRCYRQRHVYSLKEGPPSGSIHIYGSIYINIYIYTCILKYALRVQLSTPTNNTNQLVHEGFDLSGGMVCPPHGGTVYNPSQHVAVAAHVARGAQHTLLQYLWHGGTLDADFPNLAYGRSRTARALTSRRRAASCDTMRASGRRTTGAARGRRRCGRRRGGSAWSRWRRSGRYGWAETAPSQRRSALASTLNTSATDSRATACTTSRSGWRRPARMLDGSTTSGATSGCPSALTVTLKIYATFIISILV